MPTPVTTLSALTLLTPVLPQNTSTVSVDSSVLPLLIDGDLNTTRIEVGIYNTVYASDSFITTQGNNQFTFTIPLVPTVQETNVQIVGRNYDPNFTWQPNTTYALDQHYADPNGNVQSVVQAGITGATQPSWSLLTPVTGISVSVTNSVVTINSVSTFALGQQVYFTGFQNATFLNGLVLTVTSVSPGVFFTVALNTPDSPLTADDGLCQSVTADNGILWANIGTIAVTPIIKFALLFYQSSLAVTIAPPSGLSANKNQTTCELQWVTPDYPGFIGVRVMLSTDPAGINPPFTQYGDLITNVTSTAQTVISSNTSTSNNVPTAQITNVALANNLLTVQAVNSFVQGTVLEITNLVEALFLNGESVTVLNSTGTSFTAVFTALDYTSTPDTGLATSIVSTSTTTSVNTVMLTNYSSVDIPASLINNPIFYALFSTVIQDPTTNIVFESVQNGPLKAGFVNLQVTSPTDFPVLQRKEDIAGRLIAQILRQQPDIDLSPRSELRDLFIDPFAIEASNMTVREWFAGVSASISAISQVDNVSGNGISDSFASSPYKQQIARAYGLSPTDTQNLINEQFDILGELAGLTRLPASTATVVITFYTYQQPTTSIVIPQGAVVATTQDQNTPALNFQTTGSAVIDVTNLASFFNPQAGWWGVSVPAQCTTAGSVGNVGAATIQQIVSGVPSGVLVTNQAGAQFGTDQESNSAFAARIQARLVTGLDNSSVHGYLVQALSTPGVIGAEVVAAGDLEMLRDWDPTRQKHVFGCVDIYVRGTTLSEQDEFVPFQYENFGTYGVPASYVTLAYIGGNQFQIQNYNAVEFAPYDAVELLVSRSTGALYIGLDNAQFNTATGILIVNGNDVPYQYDGTTITQAKVPISAPNNTTVLQQISGALSSYTFQLFMRLSSPFTNVPTLQPVLQVYSVTGEAGQTGSVSSADIALIHTSDFLLTGGSNDAGDTVQIALVSTPVTNTITLGALSSPTLIAQGMDQPLSATGVPLDVLSVRSTDLSTLYQFGVDYNIAVMGPYHQYGIQPLTSSLSLTALQLTNNVVTVSVPNEFASAIAAGENPQVTFTNITDPTFGPLLNSPAGPFTVATATPALFTFTLVNPNIAFTVTSGVVVGSALQAGQPVVITYNEFVLYEHLSYVYQEQQMLSGTLPTVLNNDGFVHDAWLPQSYTTGIPTAPTAIPSSPGTYEVTPGGTNLGYSLILDGWDSAYGADGGLDIVGSLAFNANGLVGNQVPYANRYIKVTYFNGTANVLMKENIDYTLTVDPDSGAATLVRILTGRIPNGATVLVSYFITETFTVSTEYPTFVEVLANTIAQTKSAAASVLIKAEVANPVDITLSVTLNANTSPETVDPVIRTAINIVLDNSSTTLYQSELVSQIQAINGVQNVGIPLIKCAKSNGSYDIGVVVPTGTSWTPLGIDPAFIGINVPANSWISTNAILPDSTIPSGGEPTAIVDFLYQGQAFERTFSIQNFLTGALIVPHLAVPPGVVFDAPGSFYIIGTNDTITSATVTATSITNNVLTVNFVNGTYSVGQLVMLSNTAEAFLNGQSVFISSIITSAGLQIGFTANFMEGNFSNVHDTGSIILPASYAQKVIVTIPADVPNPGNLPYFCTYQVFNEGGAKDVTVSPTEYLAPGTITINYVTTTG